MAGATPVEIISPSFFELAYLRRHVIYVVGTPGTYLRRSERMDGIDFDVDAHAEDFGGPGVWPDNQRPKYFSALPTMPTQAALDYYAGLGGWEYSMVEALWSAPLTWDQRLNAELYGIHFAHQYDTQVYALAGGRLRTYLEDNPQIDPLTSTVPFFPAATPIPEPTITAGLLLAITLCTRRRHDVPDSHTARHRD